jgi:hypothetical protein
MSSRDLSNAIDILDLDGKGVRYAVAVDGRVRFVGSRDECARRVDILRQRDDRAYLDFMLVRAVS